jgi:D-arabinose 1-dehydrogenase-like Zn-dependent alcohol dehydrogenase
MNGMVVTDYGAALEERELPEPLLQPGHALLQVLTCGVCFSDAKIARGKMPFSGELSLPHVPGHEICARVLETDPAGALEPGTRVVVYNVWPCGICDRCRAGEEQICRAPQSRAGFTDPGGFQERVVAPLECLLVVPDGIDSVHAAPLTCALGTAYRAVVTRGGVTAGTRVAVVGVGGVGIHALQVARAAGGLAVAIDRSPRALEVAGRLGFDARDSEDERTVGALLEQTGDLGYDVVIDTVGRPATMTASERLVRPGGRIVAIGYAMDQAIEFPSARLVLEEIQLVGSRYARREELERAIRLVADGRVSMVVDRELDLGEAEQALEALETGQVVGRQVLRVSPDETQ